MQTTAALPIVMPLNAQDTAPEWIMLLPAGTVLTHDGRGPYKIADAERLAIESLRQAGGRLVVDENHATDLAAPNGGPSPAHGWLVELQARADGIWGRVEWTAKGAELLAGRAYRYISPVITHLKDGTITRILRAALTNVPNLHGLRALNQADAESDGLNDSERRVIALMGIDAEAFKRAKGV